VVVFSELTQNYSAPSTFISTALVYCIFLQDEEDIYIYEDTTLLSKQPPAQELYEDIPLLSKQPPGNKAPQELYEDITLPSKQPPGNKAPQELYELYDDPLDLQNDEMCIDVDTSAQTQKELHSLIVDVATLKVHLATTQCPG
jgi:hypothetical protein